MKSARGKGAGAASKKETLEPVDDRKVGKRKADPIPKADKSSKKKGKTEKPAMKDPNKPKRPPSAFFIFLEEFRVTFKKENPNVKGVGPVGKAGGEKWKSMSAAEKAPYEAKAAKRKTDYAKEINAYIKKRESADPGDESDKSRSEISDKHDEESGEDEDEEEDDDDDDED